jgi:hypothetical protein
MRPTDDHPYATDEVTTSDTHPLGLVARVIALVAAAVPTIIGLIAVLRIDWFDAGFDAAAVDVAGMSFTPGVAIGTLVVGLLALAAAGTAERGSKLVVGVILICVGIAILAAGGTADDELTLQRGHGWLALIVGAVLVVAGLVMSEGMFVRRRRDVRA